MSIEDNIKRGTVEMLLLAILTEDDMHGYQLCQELALRSHDLFAVQEGTVYPVLYRLSEKGYVSTRKELVGKRRTRVYYHIEACGIEYLKRLQKEYFTAHKGITDILDSIKKDAGNE